MKLKYGPYSPSRLETVYCPYLFYRSYVDPKRRRDHESLPQARGSAAHLVFEEINKGLVDGKTFNFEQIGNIVNNAVKQHPVSLEEVQEIKQMALLYLRRTPFFRGDVEFEVKLAIKFERDDKGNIVEYTDNISIPGEERIRPKFVECDYDDPDAVARGRADIKMISEDTTIGFIIDHKTQKGVVDGDTFQMGIYAWVMSICYPFLDQIETTLHFAALGIYGESVTWSKADLLKVEDHFLTLVHHIESEEEWKPRPGRACDYCPHYADCPMLNQEIIYTDPETKQERYANKIPTRFLNAHDAIKFAAHVKFLSEYTEAAKKALGKFVQEVGPIAISGAQYSCDVKQELDYDRLNKDPTLYAKLEEICEEHGISIDSYKGFSKTFSEKIFYNENQAFVDKVLSIMPLKVKKDTRWRKV